MTHLLISQALAIISLLATVAAFLVFREHEDRRHAAERERMLQRIQDPVSAVGLHAQERMDATGDLEPEMHALPFDDDEAAERYERQP